MDSTARQIQLMHWGESIMIQEIIAKFYQAIIAILLSFLILSLCFTGYFWVKSAYYQNKSDKADYKYELKVFELEQKRARELVKKQLLIDKISEDYEIEKSRYKVKVETVTREVQKIIERPVYNSLCFDSDGLRSINSIITKVSN